MLSKSKRNLFFALIASSTIANPLFAPLSAKNAPPKNDLLARKFLKGSHIRNDDFAYFIREYNAGKQIAKTVKDELDEDNFYYESFIPSDYQSQGQLAEYKNNFLSKFSEIGNDLRYLVTVDYIGTSSDPNCQGTVKPGYYTYAYTEERTIGLCDRFFEEQPSTSSMGCENQFLDEYETGAMTILHEFTHLDPPYFRLTTSPNPPFEDFEYGSAACRDLAETNPKEAILNPDNWMFVTLGTYWSKKCKKLIEPDDSPEKGSSLNGSRLEFLSWNDSTSGELNIF